MQERKKLQTRLGGPDPADDPFAPGEPVGNVTVTHGAYRESLPAAEMSVRDVRRRFQDRLDIHPEAVALVDGDTAGDDTRVRAGQTLMFVRPSGEKGGEKGLPERERG